MGGPWSSGAHHFDSMEPWSPKNSHCGALESTVLPMWSPVTQKLHFVKTKQKLTCIYLGKLYEYGVKLFDFVKRYENQLQSEILSFLEA